tara:strand:+ start:13318 stop:14550 length:1233 start_codon:yes stop_codon:yes gene_type:complete
MKKTTSSILLLFILSITNSCVEEFNAGTIEFEDAIVIEATITNEFKYQKILLSRTHKLEEKDVNPESDAIIRITTSSNNIYTFHETEPGIYISDVQFNAQPSSNYQLSITTSNGREYTSQSTQLTSNTSAIENVYAIRETNEDGVDGIGIYLDSFDPTNNSKYYGYEFEETYQILAPFWNPMEFTIPDPPNHPSYNFIWTLTPRVQEERVCYTTVNSLGRLVTSTTLLSEDRVSKILIKFISNDDLRINSRYSILVKQHTQSIQSYNYLETLNDLSNSESLLSQNQPGFLAGGIFSVNNPNEKVLGFFEISSVIQERLFFNRSDFFDSITEPFPWECSPFMPSPPETLSLKTLIGLNKVSYFFGGPPPPRPPYRDPLEEWDLVEQWLVVERHCGDCTQLGSNIKPSFWID